MARSPLLLPTGAPPHSSMTLRTRMDNDIDNLQPWSYAPMELQKLAEGIQKYELLGAKRVGEPCPVYNCHGLTFGSRRAEVDYHWPVISAILKDDGFIEIELHRTTEGDVVVYFDSRGIPDHSGIVVGFWVDDGLGVGTGASNVPLIWSKWGKGWEAIHPLSSCPYNSVNTKFYRITRWKTEELLTSNI